MHTLRKMETIVFNSSEQEEEDEECKRENCVCSRTEETRHKLSMTLAALYLYDAQKRRFRRRSSLQVATNDLKQNTNSVGLCKLSKLVKIYQIFSTIVHFVCAIQMPVDQLGGWLLARSVSTECYLGQFVKVQGIPHRYFNWYLWIFSVLLILWRIFMSRIGHKIRLEVVQFLYFANSNLILKANEEEERLALILPTLCKEESRRQVELLRSILFCRSFQKRPQYYGCSGQFSKLKRLNRTNKFRCKLLRVFHMTYANSTRFLLAALLLGVPLYSIGAYLDQKQIAKSCSNNSPTMFWFRVLLSVVMSTVMANDFFVAFLFSFQLAFILICDLLTYWKRIDVRLSRALNKRVILRNSIRLATRNNRQTHKQVKQTVCGQVNDKQINLCKFCCAIECGEGCSRKAQELELIWFERNAQLELHQLQEYITDFFEGVRDFDGFMSHLIDGIVCFWLFAVATAAAEGIYKQFEADATVVKVSQVVSFITMVSSSWFVLSLKRAVHSSYSKICTLTAICDCSERKGIWLSILEYYSPMQSASFKLFNDRHFDELALLKLVSYTVSIIVLCSSFEASRWQTSAGVEHVSLG